MMKKAFISVLCLFVLSFILPLSVKAVDFEITEATIDAYLQEDGTVEVEETFTYSFSGDFNGIIRSLNYPEDSPIVNVEAFEDGESLEIDTQEEIDHYIQRPGEDDTFSVDIHYTIENSLDVYEDMVQFYWAFFDTSNDSDYESMIVTVHPPDESDQTAAIGYDEAEASQTVLEDGSAVFDMGHVSSGENGDVRAAFDRELFADLPVTEEGSAEETILQEHQDREDQAIAFNNIQNTLADLSWYVLPAITLIYLAFILKAWGTNRTRKKAAATQASDRDIPELDMSMPATLLYTNFNYASTDTLAAALLDLVRRDKVEQLSDSTFKLKDAGNLPDHERVLVSWLFDEIGNGETFSFSVMNSYYKKQKNGSHYTNWFNKWQKAVLKEVEENELTLNKTVFRWTLGLSSFILAGLSVPFVVYDLMIPFLISVSIMFIPVLFALLHQPRTEKGWRIMGDWRTFKKQLSDMEPDDWQSWNRDEQMKAFVYGLGSNNRNVKKMAEDLKKELDKVSTNSTPQTDTAVFMTTGIFASTGFYSTSSTVSASSGGSGGSAGVGGGTGAGGGGGGSGGF